MGKQAYQFPKKYRPERVQMESPDEGVGLPDSVRISAAMSSNQAEKLDIRKDKEPPVMAGSPDLSTSAPRCPKCNEPATLQVTSGQLFCANAHYWWPRPGDPGSPFTEGTTPEEVW